MAWRGPALTAFIRPSLAAVHPRRQSPFRDCDVSNARRLPRDENRICLAKFEPTLAEAPAAEMVRNPEKQAADRKFTSPTRYVNNHYPSRHQTKSPSKMWFCPSF